MAHRLVFPPSAGVVKQLRARVRKLAATLGAPAEVCESLALVVDEVVNNAVEHGSAYRRANANLAIQIEPAGDCLSIEFFDPEMPSATIAELSSALAASANGMPSLENERGRGLFLLSIYLQNVRAEEAPAGGLRLVGTVAQK
ncbi:MAG TPA: ATP-binding protein [Planctomycetota bacterium]|nr:ATP-binding protein [Planctomycetota bacterium]